MKHLPDLVIKTDYVPEGEARNYITPGKEYPATVIDKGVALVQITADTGEKILTLLDGSRWLNGRSWDRVAGHRV
jgi:hypothetical protein